MPLSRMARLVSGSCSATMVTAVLLCCWVTIADSISFLGYEAKYRMQEDRVQKAVLLTDPGLRVQYDGYVVGWDVLISRGRRTQRVFLQVWRPITDRTYSLVGSTLYYAQQRGQRNFTLHPSDRIAVRPGDTLGIYFPWYNSIPWTQVSCDGRQKHYFKYNPSRSGTLPIGLNMKFDVAPDDWNPCREYSYNAIIMTAQEIAHYEAQDYFDHNRVDGVFNRKYGSVVRGNGDSGTGAAMATVHNVSDVTVWRRVLLLACLHWIYGRRLK